MSTAYERKATEMALASGKAPTSLEVATEVLAEGLEALGSPAPTNVTTNTLKLALTGIDAGTEVLVTGEGNRLERYMGTDPSDDANWQIIGKNTVELVLEQAYFNPLTMNGVVVDFNDGAVSLGWFDPSEFITTSDNVSTNVGGVVIVNGEGVDDPNANKGIIHYSATKIAIGVPVPPRSTVKIYIE